MEKEVYSVASPREPTKYMSDYEIAKEFHE